MSHSSECGFTLIELMIAIAVTGILLALGVPSMRDMIHQNRLSGQVNEFVAAATLARSEAIKRGRAVTLCRSVNAESGSSACDTAAGSWSGGWLVLTPNLADSTKNDILLRQGALPAGTSVTSTADTITFTGLGRPQLTADTSFIFDNDCHLSRRQVDIGPAGRTSVTTIAAAGC